MNDLYVPRSHIGTLVVAIVLVVLCVGAWEYTLARADLEAIRLEMQDE